MPASIGLLGLAGMIAVAGTSGFAYFVLIEGESPFRSVFGGYEEQLERHTRFLLLGYPGRKIARLQLIGCSVIGGLAMVARSFEIMATVVVIAHLPPAVLSRWHRRRVIRLERQLDTWLLMLANALRATSSVGEAISSTLNLVPPPFAEEVDLLVKEVRVGAPLRRATTNMARRIQSSVVSSALTTIIVATQTGGNLVVTLEHNAAALREAARLDGVLRAKTAEGRGQVILLASMPFVLSAAIWWLDPSYFTPMVRHSYGHAIIAACAALWVLASSWAYHIVRVDL